MTDLEICKRIAEIEGISEYRFINYCNAEYDDECRLISVDHYNPLTDKALCFDLMVKYDVVYLNEEAFADCGDGAGPECGGYYSTGYGVSTSSPQKAICLAIIEAHEGKS